MPHTIAALLIIIGCFAWDPVRAAYPDKPVRVIVGAAGGDTTDLIGRVAAHALAEVFKQPFVIENFAGANGNLATARVAKAKPDGHTLLLVSSAFSANSSLYTRLPYHPLRDFAPVARIANVHNVLVVQSSMGAKTLADFIAAVRAAPGKIIFASAGTGSSSHLAAELMKVRAGPLNTLHVPYKGTTPALADLLGGHVHALFASMPYASPQVRGGRLKALGVASLKRATLLPEVPTFDESGLPGFEATVWNAIVAPAGTPYDVIVRLNLGMTKAISGATAKARLTALGAEPVSDTAEQFSAYLQAEVDKWAHVIKAASITVE